MIALGKVAAWPGPQAKKTEWGQEATAGNTAKAPLETLPRLRMRHWAGKTEGWKNCELTLGILGRGWGSRWKKAEAGKTARAGPTLFYQLPCTSYSLLTKGTQVP